MCETLREPVKVLKSLSEKTTNKEYKFKRLYRNLYNPEFYFLAYKNISQSQGSMTPGVDGKSLDGMSEKRINALIESLKDFSYHPNPARRVYIEKKNSTKKRPLGIPSTEDKLVQEVVKMILESIYEPNFSDYSHGFRPNRSCHSALQQIQNQFTGITWFVEGDIHACFDSFDHHVLVRLAIWENKFPHLDSLFLLLPLPTPYPLKITSSLPAEKRIRGVWLSIFSNSRGRFGAS